MKITVSFVQLVLMMSALFCANSCADQVKDSVFWKAVRDDKTIYILGVIHIGYQAQYPVKEEIMNSLKSSSTYVMESSLPFLKNEQDTINYFIDKFKPTSGKTLEKMLSDEKCAALAEKEDFQNNMIKMFGDDVAKHLMMKSPRAIIFSAYTQHVPATQGQSEKLGLAMGMEFYLAKQSSTLGIKHAYLDPEIWDGLDELNDDDICNLAVGMVTTHMSNDFSKKNGSILMERQRDLWLSGNSKGIEKTMFQWPEIYAMEHGNAEEKWIDNRNRLMKEKIVKLSNSEVSPIFVAVGAGHLAGETGILKQLRDAEFDVSPL